MFSTFSDAGSAMQPLQTAPAGRDEPGNSGQWVKGVLVVSSSPGMMAPGP